MPTDPHLPVQQPPTSESSDTQDESQVTVTEAFSALKVTTESLEEEAAVVASDEPTTADLGLIGSASMNELSSARSSPARSLSQSASQSLDSIPAEASQLGLDAPLIELTPDLSEKIHRFWEKSSKSIASLYKDPYTAIYRVHEHGHKRISRIVKERIGLDATMNEIEYGMKDLSDIQQQMDAFMSRKTPALEHLLYLLDVCADNVRYLQSHSTLK